MAGQDTDFVATIDEGTSSTRFVLFDKHAKISFIHQIQLKNYFPKPGWIEMDAQEILDATLECMSQCIHKARSERGPSVRVHGIGITNQRETTVVWDSQTGQPLAKAIVWSDNRTAPLVKELTQRFGSADHFRKTCGLPLSPYFSAMKLLWLLEQPNVQAAVKRGTALFGTIDTWLIWKLTGGVHATDVTNASRTMLMNLSSLTWDKPTCEALNIPMELLPQIKSCAEVYGNVKEGILKGVPLSGVVGDQQAALLGQLCVEKGTAKNTYGTGCFMLMNTGDKPIQSTQGLLTTVAFQLGKHEQCQYALEGSVAVAGSAMRWLRDGLGLVKSGRECDEEAMKVKESGGVYFVPAFSGLLSPYWRPDARGVLTGLTQFTTKSHVCRAVLESVAYATKELLDGMSIDSGLSLKTLKVDGGMARSKPLMQFQADLLGVPVQLPSSLEATARGAAIAAGLGCGFWSNLDEVQAMDAKSSTTTAKAYSPDMRPEVRQFLMEGWKSAVQRTFDQARFLTPTSEIIARSGKL